MSTTKSLEQHSIESSKKETEETSVQVISDRVSQLSSAKRALLQRLLLEKSANRTKQATIPRRTHRSVTPLSFAQQRLWFLDQLDPGSPLYNLPVALRLRGPLLIAALEQALGEVIHRHEVLRTRFVVADGQAAQVISETELFSLTVIDLSHLPETERDAKAKQMAQAEAAQSFDLSQWPLLRVKLLRLSTEEHFLLLTMHHIISDGWSMGVLVREVSALYEAFSNNQPSPLPSLPIQYADYAVWQREQLQGEALERQLAYWREQLLDAPQVLELPTDRPRPLVQSYRGSSISFLFDRELLEQVKMLSREQNVTLFMTLLAAFQTLLYRYSNQQDILVGTPIANRTRAETEGLIGFFVNTLVLRGRFSEKMTFRELLEQRREVTLGAYAHQELPFEQIVEELRPERSLSHTPLFQVMFTLQNTPLPAEQLRGVQMSIEGESGEQAAKFELSLSLREVEAGLAGAFDFRTELFEAETIQRMIRHFEQVLRAVVTDAERKVSGIELLSTEERRQILQKWNETTTDYPHDRCLHELFEEQVERAPDALAVVFEEQQLSYQELNQRANQLAHYLRELGVGPEQIVGIMMNRSIEMVISVLAVLKAGAAYLPLDPEYPQERLSFMLKDAAAKVLLVGPLLPEQLPHTEATVIAVNQCEGIRRQSVENPVSEVGAENLAYVIYTSGSTGKPKGVQARHAGVSNVIAASIDRLGVGTSSRVMQAASLSFDASVLEIFSALLSGASLFMIARETLLSPSDLSQFLQANAISVWIATPSLLEILPDQKFPALRTITVGAEKCGAETAKLWSAGSNLFNLYAPTEATIYSTAHLCRENYNQAPPVGKPIANTQVYLLDAHLQPVPIGVIGELHIGGAGLARGYRNQHALTAERFIPHPFSTEPGARLYRTGDLARYLPDGNIEFIGRIDEQVKVRGYRIELGEIETVLSQHELVKEAVVTLREDESGEKHLVAYVVAADMPQTASSQLREHLREHLPTYMIPSAFVMLDELPLTPSGKLDRRALPSPQLSALESEQSYLAPQTEIEQLMAQLWQAVLRVERVGVNDNFFELGGHSLLATQLVSRIREAFEVELPVRSLFEHPTVAALAAVVEQALLGGAELTAPPIERAPREQPLPLSFAQQRLWFFDQLRPNTAIYNMPAAVRQTGPLDLEALDRTLSEIVRRHEVLRTTFSVINGRAVQIISAPTPIGLPVIDLSELSGTDQEMAVRRLVDEEAQRPFDLAQGPLLRFTLLRLGIDQHVVLMTMHHIVSDGWSTAVFIKEIAALYEAYSGGKPSPLPELKIQYADYAVWQRRWLQGEVLEKHLAYWKQQLAHAPHVLNLPTNRPRPVVQSYRGAQETITLSAELAERVKTLSRREGVTLFMTLLAAFQTLLYRYAGHDRIVVGSPIAGRNRAETEGLIGFFVNTLVMCTDFSGSPNFLEVLGRVREAALGAYAHQDMPFEKLVDEIAPERSLSSTPLVQVMFVLQNIPAAPVRLTGLNLSQVDIQSEAARFDLHLGMSDTTDGLYATLTYSTDLFETATVKRLLGNLELLLRHIVEQPDSSISSLVELLTKADEQRSLTEERNFKEASSRQLRGIKRRVAAKPLTERQG